MKAEGRPASVSRLEEDSFAEANRGETRLLSRLGAERLVRAGRGPVCTRVGRCTRLTPLCHREPFLSLSRPKRPVAQPTARDSRNVTFAGAGYARVLRVSTPSVPRSESTRRCVRDRKALPLGANPEAQVATRKRVEADERRRGIYNMRLLCVVIAIASAAFLLTTVSGESLLVTCTH